METMPEKKFSNPDEEIAFLRAEVARRERALLERNKEVDAADIETLGRRVVEEYSEHDPTVVLERGRELSGHELARSVELVSTTTHKVEELTKIMRERGIRNMLTVLEAYKDPFLTDEIHRRIVDQLRQGYVTADLKEGMPLWSVLHMTLFEVAPPQRTEDKRTELRAVFAAMEQFYAGMQTVGGGKVPQHYAIEIAVSDKQDDIIFYVAVPNEFVNLFEKQALSLFPNVTLIEQKNDYNIFVEGGESLVAIGKLEEHPIYPLRTHDTFENDPLAVLLNAFSKIEREGGGAAVQLVVGGGAAEYHKNYKHIVWRMEHEGESRHTAIKKSTFSGEFFEEFKGLFSSPSKQDDSAKESHATTNAPYVELFNSKLQTPIVGTNLRVAVSARSTARAEQIMREIEAGFSQFQNTKGNQITFKHPRGPLRDRALRAYSFREWSSGDIIPLSLRELSTIMHFPEEGIESSPQFKQSRAKRVAAPINLPQHGTLLGVNEYRNVETNVYLTPEDRLRHFYVIGQTGTGKTTLLKNMIVQDIRAGAGVCMIDPHGTDIMDVLAAIPPERMDDLIYFDPSRMDRVIGLNMLEYDPRYPEQKTFVVNELFSIFQKLYGANPESMGPMFEQYFRNATLLVLEDPASGSTLLDISRVMADAAYRRMKLERATNPVVVQFWQQIATKAGGEASLENIVPYIVSKFDVFTANDYMRPIIGQQHSSFNFRDIMDNKKILLVNLSKGRLGEINANLIGMIIVGKILMAALSRVDDATRGFPPFYLYIDEFQNVTTNSISAILSEARKYKLGLTVAHQFIAQLDEKIRESVFGNVGSMAAFRVGPEDSQALAKQFEPTFTANDLMNIENRNAYVRILAEGSPTQPFSIRTVPPHESDAAYAEELIEYSLLRHGVPRAQVEADIIARYRK